jgi:hypothetical protein
VDPVDVSRAVEGLDPEATLVVVISKTFTTAETMLNARTLKDWLLKSLASSGASDADIISKHVVACSSNIPATTSFGIAPANVFGFWDWVGGRYSVCSAVGVVPLALHYGFDVVERFLAGARSVDAHFLSADFPSVSAGLVSTVGCFACWHDPLTLATSLAEPTCPDGAVGRVVLLLPQVCHACRVFVDSSPTPIMPVFALSCVQAPVTRVVAILAGSAALRCAHPTGGHGVEWKTCHR